MKNVEAIDQLIDRVAGLLRTDARRAGAAHQLQPVQLEALDYLNRANRYSDTAMAVTEYLGQTKGTVSQTLKVLLNKGYIEKRPDPEDKRIFHLAVTPTGRRALSECKPSPLLRKAAQLLENGELEITVKHLRELLHALQEANNFRTFGQCSGCVHNMVSDGDHWCGLTRQPLSISDTQLICREFTSREQWHPIGKR